MRGILGPVECQPDRLGRNRIARLMRQQGLCGRQQRRFRVRTTESNHDQPIAPNRLTQAPPPDRPNQVWAADITYVQTRQGWVYLAAILDLYSRRIVGWSVSSQINTALVLAALRMALGHRKPSVISGWANWFAVEAERFVPRSFVTKIAAKAMRSQFKK